LTDLSWCLSKSAFRDQYLGFGGQLYLEVLFLAV